MRTVAASIAAAIVCALAFTSIAGTASAASAASPSSPARLAVIVPITVPETDHGFIDSTLLESYTSPFGLLSRTLDEVIDRPVTLAIDPAIIASIRILGDAAPASALAWLDRLASAENETFPLLWADSDVTAPLQAGAPGVLTPGSFDFAIDPSHFSTAEAQPLPSPEPTGSAAPEADTGPPPLPTSETLTAWDYTISSIVWPALNSVTADDLATLGASFDTTILSSGNVSGLGAGSAHATIDSNSVLVTDEELSALFTSTVETRSGTDWESAMADLNAAAAAPESLSGSDATIIALDRVAAATDADLGATIDSLAANPSITPTTLSDVLGESASAGTLVERPQDADRIDAVRTLLTAETGDRAYTTIAANPSLITSERRLDLLSVLGNSWRDDAIGWATAVGGYIAESDALRSRVTIVDSSAITLLADRASLPVTVSNDFGQPVTVFVTVRPLTPLLKVEDSFVALTVEAHSQRKAQIPVQSLANGVVEIEVSLHRENGIQVGDTAFVETTVQAGWETPVTIVLAVLVVLIFVAGIVRTIIRRRRPRTTEA